MSAKLLAINSLRHRPRTHPLGIIVFSKDRPLQLHALLASLLANVRGDKVATVIWCASSEKYRRGYSKLREMDCCQGTVFCEQSDFKEDVVSALEQDSFEAVMFLVDDIVFISTFDTRWLESIDLRHCVPSLRLDSGISFSQTHGQPCPPPSIKPADYPCVWQRFSWMEGSYCWSMPLALDGNIFPRREILALAKGTSYRAPNSFEEALGPYRFLFKYREGRCLHRRAIVNIALNRVQTENAFFPCGDTDAEELLRLWMAGQTLDVTRTITGLPEACHVTAAPHFIDVPI